MLAASAGPGQAQQTSSSLVNNIRDQYPLPPPPPILTDQTKTQATALVPLQAAAFKPG